MSLSRLILASCGLIAVSLALVFSLFFSQLSHEHQDAVAAAEAQSVLGAASSVLAAKRFLLESILKSLSRDPVLAKTLLVSRGNPQRMRLVEAMGIQRRVEGAKLSFSSQILPLSSRLVPDLFRLSVTGPVLLHSEPVGSITLALDLTGEIQNTIEQMTGTKISFHPSPSFREAGRVRIGASSLPLYINAGRWNGLAIQVHRKAIVWSAVLLLGALAALFWFLNLFFVRQFRKFIQDVQNSTKSLEEGSLVPFAAGSHRMAEMRALDAAFATFSAKVITFEKTVATKSRTEAIGEIASQVAHDLNGPVFSLETALEIEKEKLSKESFDAISHLLGRIRAIVSDISANSQKRQLEREPLGKILERIMQEKRLAHSVRPILFHLNVEATARDLLVDCDTSALFRVLSNLLDNAVQAIPSQGEVTLSSRVEPRGLRLEIIDTGRGLSKEEVRQIGIRGVSLNKPSGEGLGLWNAKDFVTTLGGQLQIESTPGRGTSVVLWFPVTSPAMAEMSS